MNNLIKKTIIIGFSTFYFFLFSCGSFAMQNPGVAYCQRLGYEHKVKEDEKGNQYGVCVLPNGEECDDFDFLSGQCGGSYGYCARQGLSTKPVIAGEPGGAICLEPNGKEVGNVIDLSETKLSNDVCGDGVCSFYENYKNCLQDCPSGGKDYYCDRQKDGICDPDCEGFLYDPDCEIKQDEKGEIEPENKASFLSRLLSFLKVFWFWLFPR